MVWCGISARGRVGLVFTSSRMNSEDCQDVLATHLLPFCRQNRRGRLLFQQDNPPIHISDSTKAWFQANNIGVLEWPPKSPDMNPVENLWGILVRKIYENGEQYSTVEDLKNSIEVV